MVGKDNEYRDLTSYRCGGPPTVRPIAPAQDETEPPTAICPVPLLRFCVMGTLDEIQKLSDGEFHLLGDALLRRLDPRYRLLRTHGLNDRGESINGQPDSYVGDTAATCRVAVCYTVQRWGGGTR